MVCTAPKYIGFEQELANHLVGLDCEDNALRAAEAIVHAHHRSFGVQRDFVTCIANEFDPLGFRVYVDHLHAEISSPLTPSARDLVLVGRAARQMLLHCKREAEKEVGPIRLGLDNTNRQGTAWGFHLNALASRSAFDRWRDADWQPLLRQWVPFVVTSPGLFGGGKVGTENGAPVAAYQLSQRSDFMTRVVGLETVSSKSLINTRDEALADPERYARIHIVCFDTNRCEFASWLKFVTTQLLLSLIEEKYPLANVQLREPLKSLEVTSRDLRFNRLLELDNGTKMTALEIQYRLAESVSDAVLKGSAASQVPDASLAVSLWIGTLQNLADSAPILTKRLDWRARLALIQQVQSAPGAAATARAVADLQFGELGGAFDTLELAGEIERLEDFLPSREALALEVAPRERARGLLLERFGAQVLDADWFFITVQDQVGNAWALPLDNPCDSKRLVTAIQAPVPRSVCLQGLIREGLAKKCDSVGGLLVVGGSQNLEDLCND